MMLPKPQKIVSRAIRESARCQQCTLRIPGVCNHNPETTVFAHLNTKYKGMGNKSPDIFGVYACSACHAMLDSSRVKISDQFNALIETQMRLFDKNLLTTTRK